MTNNPLSRRSFLTAPGVAPVKPYLQEHMDMVAGILGKGPYLNEGMAVAESTMTCIMVASRRIQGGSLPGT
jgi:hypothetical protein